MSYSHHASLVAFHSIAIMAMASCVLTATAAQHWIGERDRVQEWNESAPADRIRFGVKDTGVYAVSDSELATASGLSMPAVAQLLDQGLCRLECGGEPVAWSRFDSGIRFYGEALPYSAQAPENVYYATLGESGPQIAVRPAPPDPAAQTNELFTSTVRVAETTMAGIEQLASATNHSMLLVKSLVGGATYTRTVKLPDVASGTWNGTVTAGMYSVFDVGTDNHSARLKVGAAKATIATTSWTGENVATVSGQFPSTCVADGALSVTIDNTLNVVGSNYPRFYLEWLEIEYQRYYMARTDFLSCPGGTKPNICVTAFTKNTPVFAWDVSTPRAPVALSDIESFATASAAGVVFSCDGPDSSYAVFAAQGCYEPSIRGVRDIDWSDSDFAADYVILIPPEGWVDGFRAALEPLAKYRSNQHLRTVIVDVETVYNRYSHGLAIPEAIREFARAAYANWRIPPRYLLLAGHGNADYHHKYTGFQGAANNDYSRCLIPPFIAPQRIYSAYDFSGNPIAGDGVVITEDVLFGDVDPLLHGPEIAVGRFIAVTPAQAAKMVERTIAYEQNRPRRQMAVLAADYPIRITAGLAFSNVVNRAADKLESIGWRTTRVIPTDGDAKSCLSDERRRQLLPALAADAGLFHYSGHANLNFLGNSNMESNWLLRYTNITGEKTGSSIETRWSFPPIAFWVCCQAGTWHITSSTQSLVAYGARSVDSGFTAIICSSGLSGDRSGDYLCDAFYTLAHDRSTLRLGDAWRDAMCAIAASSYPECQYLCFGILGDPAIVFRPDRPSTGSVIMIQ